MNLRKWPCGHADNQLKKVIRDYLEQHVSDRNKHYNRRNNLPDSVQDRCGNDLFPKKWSQTIRKSFAFFRFCLVVFLSFLWQDSSAGNEDDRLIKFRFLIDSGQCLRCWIFALSKLISDSSVQLSAESTSHESTIKCIDQQKIHLDLI